MVALIRTAKLVLPLTLINHLPLTPLAALEFGLTNRGEQMNKHYNDKGEIGVIVSGGFGAGWSSWNSSHRDFLTMDKTLVEMCLQQATIEKVENYLESHDIDIYLGGWEDCHVEYIPPNTHFNIYEYDGSESIMTADDLRQNTGE